MMQIIGLMSGTSLDGVDAALVETDGREHVRPLHGLTLAYDEAFQARLRALIAGGEPHAQRLATSRDLTLLHAEAVNRLLVETGKTSKDIALIGFHGQTTFHDPAHGLTEQAGDAPLLEARTGIRVISDFRRPLVARGHQGAPLVPIYHQALAAKLPKPCAFLNIGGVANITLMSERGTVACDTGPGNALLNDWVNLHLSKSHDENGALALSGNARMDIVEAYLHHPFFAQSPPKSLDRNAFSLEPLKGLDVMDGAATLVVLTAEAVKRTLAQLGAEADTPVYVCGGGRHNPAMMQALGNAKPVEALGYNGDFIEAEAFAYLAARRDLGLSIALDAGA